MEYVRRVKTKQRGAESPLPAGANPKGIMKSEKEQAKVAEGKGNGDARIGVNLE